MELISDVAGQLVDMTIITPIIEPEYLRGYVPERAQVFNASSKGKLAKGLLISTLVHLIGLVIVIFSTTFESGVTSAHKPAPISATLYFPKVSVNKTIAEAPASTEITPPVNETKAQERPLEKVIETTERPKVAETQPVKVKPTEAKPTETKEDKAAPTEAPAPTISNARATINSTTRNQQAGTLNLSPRASASQFFNRREQEEIAEEGLRAAEAHRQKIESPDLVDTRKGEEDRSYYERPVKKVNCSGTTNKALTVLSGLAGGTLECSKGSDYDRFIEARLAKEPVKD
ncbi:hypothetical protein [Alteromonas stellipolaris]|uniref:hypothetical protein n=1 Tax=Alteromonas stellipolaris TaxID=233316 RepID=UPI0026E2CE9D|nr:hypothetical protein [Alteromonas stellipolaris]MDO6535942.1 hypothetical protein [Alteromonas stellipolaris]MDO6627625.1 hypothetical protein [Alteromonas stellipolaris]